MRFFDAGEDEWEFRRGGSSCGSPSNTSMYRYGNTADGFYGGHYWDYMRRKGIGYPASHDTMPTSLVP